MEDLKTKLDNYIENILQEKIEDVFSNRFSVYAKYIIQDRAIPDARDGLKPVQRRILYAMYKLGVFHNKAFVKSARIAGEIMGKFHPHGDSSIYEAMVRLSQNWKMGLLLIDMQGNNGSIDGDGAAAMRYTEARLSLASEYLLKDIDKKTVNFVPNFDDTEVEPVVLPVNYPNLLVNGTFGISIGFSTKIPPHNIGEIIDLTVYIIDHEEDVIGIDKVLEYVKGPDFPTGGIVMGLDGIKSAFSTGLGKVIVRSKTDKEDMGKGQERIIVTEIPYEVNKSELVKQIDDIRISQDVPGILEVRDETDKEGLRIAIDLEKNADLNVVLNYLFKSTSLQINFNYNMVSIINHRPVTSGVVSLLRCYIDHQKDVKTNRCNYDLEKAKKRLHIVEGLIKMVSILDEVIAIIKASNDKADSKVNLIKRWQFSEDQAEAILVMQLYRLSNTDIVKLTEEQKTLSAEINGLQKILSNESLLLKLIKQELLEAKAALATPRKSLIENEVPTIVIDKQQLVSSNPFYVGITKDGYIKKSTEKQYVANCSLGLKEADYYIYEKLVSNLNTLLIFTNKGNYVSLPVFKIDDQKWKEIGKFISNYVPLDKDERIIDILSISDFKAKHSILLATSLGKIKRTGLSEFEITRQSKPSKAIGLEPGDSLVSIDIGFEKYVVIGTSFGYLLKFKTEDGLSEIKSLQATGPQGIALVTKEKTDSCIGAVFASEDDEIVFMSTRGSVIKINNTEIRGLSRNRKGQLVINPVKTNPNYGISLFRITRGMYLNNSSINIFTDLKMVTITASDTKYHDNKNGKSVLDTVQDGVPCRVTPILSKDDLIGFSPEPRPVTDKPVESRKPLLEQSSLFDEDEPAEEEEIETEPIIISRLDEDEEF